MAGGSWERTVWLEGLSEGVCCTKSKSSAVFLHSIGHSVDLHSSRICSFICPEPEIYWLHYVPQQTIWFSFMCFLCSGLSTSFQDKPTPPSTEVMPEQFPVPKKCLKVYKWTTCCSECGKLFFFCCCCYSNNPLPASKKNEKSQGIVRGFKTFWGIIPPNIFIWILPLCYTFFSLCSLRYTSSTRFRISQPLFADCVPQWFFLIAVFILL